MKLPSCPRTLIINILRNNPDGLTLTSIAKLTGLHRHTATKYIYELKGAGIINERDVGSAKLCYLKEGFSKEDEKKVVRRLNGSGGWKKSSSGQVQILTLFLFLFLIPTSVIIAQNATLSINNTLNITGLLLGENSTLENITAENASAEKDLQHLPNLTLPNETSANISVSWENITGSGLVGNETASGQDNATIIESNITEQETNKTVPIEPQNPVLEVRISSPGKITRGEEFDISAVVTNSGKGEARNVRMLWEIPSGFEIVSGETSAECGTILPDSEYTTSLTLSSSVMTDTGRSEFKVKATYEK